MTGPHTHQEYFDALAPIWEERVSPRARAAIAEIVAGLGLPAGGRALDLGTGTGVAIPALRAALGPAGCIVALDVSLGMLRQAREGQGEEGITYVQADGGELPFREGAFAALLCNATFPHLRDKPGALREMRRVLAPGGWLWVTHVAGRQRTNEIHERAGGVIGNDRVPEAAEMRAMLEAAGFGAISVADEAGRYVAKGQRPL